MKKEILNKLGIRLKQQSVNKYYHIYLRICILYDLKCTFCRYRETTTLGDLLQAHLRPAVVGEWCCR